MSAAERTSISRNSMRNDYSPFHQLDLRIDKQYFFKRWSLNFYADVQNVYNFKSETQDNLVREATLNGQPG